MNCKPGDLAVVIKSWPAGDGFKGYDRIGAIITVTRLSTEPEFSSMLCWEFEEGPWIYGEDYERVEAIPDSWLRPLRDNPGTDETLTWAPVPHKETA